MIKVLRSSFIFAAALIFFCACNELRGPVIDERDDVDILGTLIANHGKYNLGETVELTFTIKNISAETVILSREGAYVQDLIMASASPERRWSDDVDEGLAELKLEPGESSTIEWEIEGLSVGVHTFVGYWWSSGIREVDVVVVIEYGAARY